MRPERRGRSWPGVVWAMTVVFAAACATSPRGYATGAAPAAVRVDAALLAMADARRADLPLLDSILQGVVPDVADPRRHRRAVLLIGQLRVPERYPLLRSLTTHTDTALSATAVFALGLARDTASLDVLSQSVRGLDEGTAAEAAWALGQIGEPARDALESALRAVLEGRLMAGGERRGALLRAASTLRPVPTPLLAPFLLDADARAAGAAAYGIARSRAASGVRALLAQAGHHDAYVRAQVAAGAAPALIGDSLLSEALRLLPTLMRDSDMQVRVQAVRSAGAIMARWDSTDARPAASSELRDALQAAMRDPMTPVRVTAAEGIAPVLANDAVAWQQRFDADSTFMVQRALLEAGARRGQLGAARSMWQQHADPWRRAAAFELDSRGQATEGRVAESVLDRSAWARLDTSPRVRAAAATALARTSDQTTVRTVLEAMRADTAPLVRAAAIGAFAARATAGDARWAVRAMQSEATPDGYVVRSAALRVIAAAWRRDSTAFDAELVALLGQLPVAEDPLVRRGVRDVTPMAHWAAVNGPVVAKAEYTRVAAQWLGTTRPVTARLHTERGVITLTLLSADAPLTVDNFVQLARRRYFDNTRFHRVIAGFVAQDGDPTGTGSGGPGTSIRDELNRHRYERGAVGMALSGPDTGGSQYFLTLTPQPHLDGGYTVFARVTEGLDVMDALVLGDRILRVEVR